MLATGTSLAFGAFLSLLLSQPVAAQAAKICDASTKICVDPALSGQVAGGYKLFDLRGVNPDLSMFDTSQAKNADGVVKYGYDNGPDADSHSTVFTIKTWQEGGFHLTSNFYVFYGKATIRMKGVQGQGSCAAFALISDYGDEVDYELLGTYPNQGQTNWFSGYQTAVSDVQSFDVNHVDEFHNYTIDYRPDKIIWSVDGNAVRTLVPSTDPNTKVFPSTPMGLKFGPWLPGSPISGSGTQQWSGSAFDPAKTNYQMFIQYIEVQDYSDASTYQYAGLTRTDVKNPFVQPAGAGEDGQGPKVGQYLTDCTTSYCSVTTIAPPSTTAPVDTTAAGPGSEPTGSPTTYRDAVPETTSYGCTTITANAAAFSALVPALVTVWDTGATAEVKTAYAGQAVLYDSKGLPYTSLPSGAGYMGCGVSLPPATQPTNWATVYPNGPSGKLRKKARRQVPGAVAQPWSATTQCFTSIANQAMYNAMSYAASVHYNDAGMLTTENIPIGASTSWDQNGFPVTIFPSGAGQVYCTTSVDFGVTYTPTVATTWWTPDSGAVQTGVATVVPYSAPVAASAVIGGGGGDSGSAQGMVQYSTLTGGGESPTSSSAPQNAGAGAARFKFSNDPGMVILTFGGTVLLGLVGGFAAL